MIVRFQVLPDCEARFETGMQAIASITAEDPDYHYYSVARIEGETGGYLVSERFADDAALVRHMNDPRIGAVMAEIEPCLAGAPAITRMEFLN
ncbi:putative quinol monooxygenase [Leifsonia kafniensis]